MHRCATGVLATEEGAHAVVRVPDLAVRTDVGDVGQGLVAEPVAADGRGGRTGMQGAVETLGEVELLLVGEVLVANTSTAYLSMPARIASSEERSCTLRRSIALTSPAKTGVSGVKVTVMRCSCLENKWVILIEVRATTNTVLSRGTVDAGPDG